MLYRLEVSPGGKRKYIPEKKYHRPMDGIVLVKTEPGCSSTSTVVVGGVEIQPLADLVGNDALAAAVVQLHEELAHALWETLPRAHLLSHADRAREMVEHILKQLIAQRTK